MFHMLAGLRVVLSCGLFVCSCEGNGLRTLTTHDSGGIGGATMFATGGTGTGAAAATTGPTGGATSSGKTTGTTGTTGTTVPQGVFIPAGNMTVAREGHTATLLPNGKVLIAGGLDYDRLLASAELYDPATGTFTATGSITMLREVCTATSLPNGKVLIAGGVNRGGSLASAELYDPATGTFTVSGSMSVARDGHTATLLPNGKVLVAGGYNDNGINNTFLASAELYDPTAGTFTVTGSMSVARDGHTATLLPNGVVLVAGGYNDDNGINSTCLASTELYDPTAGTFTVTGSMSVARCNHTATLLPNGMELIAGGFSSTEELASAELYQ